MPTVDERVVELKLDNKDLKRNASESERDLTKLKAALNFSNAIKNMNELSTAAKNMSVSGISNTFSNLAYYIEQVGMSGLSWIDRIFGTLEMKANQFIRQNTIDQISVGWGKYADKTAAVQTIMSATANKFEDTGVQMEYVNEQLGKLNWFTDETSYSFLDMVSNIGKFTSQNVDLDKSVTAMQGISTWAASAGAGVGEAGRAMYNLAQALATGEVKLMDWRSIENANMSTVEFKNVVMDAAVKLGKLTKAGEKFVVAGTDIEVSIESFNDTLQKGWFTKDVLMDALNTYGDFTNKLYEFSEATGESATHSLEMIDQFKAGTLDLQKTSKSTGVSVEELSERLTALTSNEMALGRKAFAAAQEAKTFRDAVDSVKEAASTGWMQTFEYIFGNYLEAKSLWTSLANELYDIFVEPLNIQNEILEMWHNGITDVAEDTGEEITVVTGGYESLRRSLGNLAEGIHGLMDAVGTGFEDIFSFDTTEVAERVINLTNRFEKLTESFKNMFAPAEAVEEEIEEVTRAVTSAISPVEKTKEVLDQLAKDTINGVYGHDQERIDKLRELGYSYEMIQNRVNELLGCSKRYEIREEDLTAAIAEGTEVLDEQAEVLFTLDESTEDLTDSVERVSQPAAEVYDWADKITRISRGLFASIDIVRMSFVHLVKMGLIVAKAAFAALKPVIEAAGVVMAGIADAIVAFRDELVGTSDSLEFFGKIADAVYNIISQLVGVIMMLVDSLRNHPVVVKFAEALDSVRQSIKNMFSAGIEKIGDFFSAFALPDSTVDALYQLGEALILLVSSIGSFAIDKISAGFTAISNFVTNAADKAGNVFNLTDAFNGLVLAVANFIKTVANGEFNPFTALADSLKVLAPYLENFGKFIDNVANAIVNFGKSMLDPEKTSIGFGTIISWLIAGGTIKGISNLTKALVNLLKGINAILDVPKAFEGVLSSASDLLGEMQSKVKSESIWNIAKSIGVMAAALFVLSMVPVDALESATAALFIVMGTFAGIMALYFKLTDKGDDEDNGVTALTDLLSNFLDGLQKAFKKAMRMVGIASIIVGIVLAAILLKKAYDSYAEIPWPQFISNIGKLFIVIGLLVGATIAATRLGNGAASIGFALAILAMAYAVQKLVEAMDDLSRIPDFKKVGLAVGGVIVAFGKLVKSFKGADTVGVAASLLLVAVAMQVIVGPLERMAALPFGKLAQSILAMATMLIVLGGTAKLLGDGSSRQAVVNILLLASTLIILSGALAMISSIGGGAGVGLLIIAGAMAVFLASAWLAGKVAPGLVAMSTALTAFGTTALMISGAMFIAGAAITLFSGGLPKLVKAIIKMGADIRENTADFVAGFTALFVAIAGAITLAQVPIGNAVVSVISGIISALVSALPSILSSTWVGILAIMGFLLAVAPDLVKFLFDLVTTIINALADIIRNNIEPLLLSILNVLDAIVDAVFNAIVDIIGELVEGLVNAIAGIFGKEFDFTEQLAGIKEWGNGFLDDFNHKAQETEEAGKKAGGGFIEGLKSMFTGKQAIAPDVEIDTSMAEAESRSAGEATGEAFDESMNSSLESADATGGLGMLFGEMDTFSMDSVMQMGSNAGFDFSQYFGEGITDSFGVPMDALGSGIADMNSDASANLESGGYTAGSDFDSGLAGGIRDYVHVPVGAASRMASSVVAETRRVFDENSPSKEGREIGGFFPIGIAQGITAESDRAVDAASSMGYDVISATGDFLKEMDSYTGYELKPRIEPVFDGQNIQNGMRFINGLIDTRSISLAGMNDQLYAQNLALRNAHIEAYTRNDDVVGVLSELRDEMAEYADAVNSRQIVMDSGTVVGELTNKMDKSIRLLNARRNR